MEKEKHSGGRSSAPQLSKLAKRILVHICDTRIGVGSHLGEEALARQFKVSRTPVRSALQLLTEMGIVEKRLNQGYFVIADPGSLVGDRLVQEDPEDSIYFRIVEDRLTGRLPERLSEVEFMRRYGLTKTRLSALLRTMAQEGWVARLPGHGWEFLPVLVSEESYDQGYQFRTLVEPAALLLDSFHMSAGEIDRLRKAQQAMLDGGLLRYSRTETFQIGAQFHEAIAAASGNPFYHDAIMRMNRLRRLLDYRTQNDRSRLVQTCKEHLALLDLIEAGRQREASELLRGHLERERRTKLPLTREAGATTRASRRTN